jgi:hypothetical protein
MNSIPWLVDDKLKKKVASKQQKKYIQDTLKSNKNGKSIHTVRSSGISGHGDSSKRS